MKRIAFLFLLNMFFFCCISQSFSQIVTNQGETLPVIEVNGTAEKEVVPDEIFILITLKERLEGKNKITIEEQEHALKVGVQKIGISLENLFLADAHSNYISVKWIKKDVISKTNYILKVTDATTVGRVFELLDKLQIQDAKISHVSHSKIEELTKEVRIEAITEAQHKANYLLEAIGQKTGKAIYVREDNYHVPVTRSYAESNVMMKSNFSLLDEVDTQIQFKKITITAHVYVRFLIE